MLEPAQPSHTEERTSCRTGFRSYITLHNNTTQVRSHTRIGQAYKTSDSLPVRPVQTSHAPQLPNIGQIYMHVFSGPSGHMTFASPDFHYRAAKAVCIRVVPRNVCTKHTTLGRSAGLQQPQARLPRLVQHAAYNHTEHHEKAPWAHSRKGSKMHAILPSTSICQ